MRRKLIKNVLYKFNIRKEKKEDNKLYKANKRKEKIQRNIIQRRHKSKWDMTWGEDELGMYYISLIKEKNKRR